MPTLRGRYTRAAVAIAIAVLLSAALAQSYVGRAARENSARLKARAELLAATRRVLSAVEEAEGILAADLLVPYPEARSQWDRSLDEARTWAGRLDRSPVAGSDAAVGFIATLQTELEALRTRGHELMEIRLDPELQHPALRYARGTMLPLHQSFLGASQLALDELAPDLSDPAAAGAYQELVAIRHSWSALIATYRMYLLNRIGSFSTGILTTQADDIEMRATTLEQMIAALRARADDLGLVAADSLDTMMAAARAWLVDFRKVREINESGRWRTDVVLLTRELRPSLDRIISSLHELERRAEHESARDIEVQNAMAHNVALALWGMALFGLLVIGSAYLYLDRGLLRPLARISQALKSEALGGDAVPLPATRVEETRNLVEAFAEMRSQIRSRQEALEHQALHDALTGLPNRSLLNDRLAHAIALGRREGRPLALLVIDLDHFKEINDTLGHQTGDRVLQEIARRLPGTVREADTVARLGGDEFAVLLLDAAERDARRVAAKILDTLREVVAIGKHHLYVGGSIGIALCPGHSSSGPALLRFADIAMYTAKRNKSGYAVYEPDLDQHSVGRLGLSAELLHALEHEELELFYQPQFDARSGRPSGAEALLRWNRRGNFVIAPDEVVQLAERTGLIQPLTAWIIRRALEDCARWQRHGRIGVAINLSVLNLQEEDLAPGIARHLAELELDPALVTFEVTETAMMSDPERAIHAVEELHGLGVGIAVDDYGTGFSSLAYLKRLAVDELKIDRSFVSGMDDDEDDYTIVRSTVEMAHNLGLTVTAEGVEEQRTWVSLRQLGCDHAQGYYLGRPRPASEIRTWLAGLATA